MKQNEFDYDKKKKRVNITVDPQLWEAFQNRCSDQNATASGTIELLVREFLEKNRQMKLL